MSQYDNTSTNTLYSNTLSCPEEASGRIGYMDAMRGLSIILVVFGHVLLVIDPALEFCVLNSILTTFTIPLFFFISGFFAYRSVRKWTKTFCKSTLKRKVQAQVICTIVFYSLFQFCNDKSPLIVFHEGFSWFWFTVVLFQMFIIYMILAVIEHLGRTKNVVTPALIILSSLFVFIRIYLSPISEPLIWKVLQWGHLFQYFQFFSLGIICRKYHYQIYRCLSNDTFRTITILTYISALFAVYGFNGELEKISGTIYNIFLIFIVRYSGLLTVFILFFSNKTYFSGESRPCRWLRFVGLRTLDIYMMHIFFLPNLIFLKPYLIGAGMFLNQLTIGLVVAILDITVCLFVSSLLRCSSFLSCWLFGDKTPRKENLSTSILMP